MDFLDTMAENASIDMQMIQEESPQAALRNTVPAPLRKRSDKSKISQRQKSTNLRKLSESEMKPNNVVVDEMFPEGAGPFMDLDEAGGPTGLLMDLAANEKAVHADFYDEFEDLYDDDDLS